MSKIDMALHSIWAKSTAYSNPLVFSANKYILSAFAALKQHSLGSNHIAHNIDWKWSTPLKYVLKSANFLTLNHIRKPPRMSRVPINSTMLTQLANSLSFSDPFDPTVIACALAVTAFWAQCRLGELMLPYSSNTPFASLNVSL